MHPIVSKSVVITGSTRGIGFSLAEAFLQKSYPVTISGRTTQAVNEAVKKLSAEYDETNIFGYACDVTDFQQVQNLWDAVKQHFGSIDIWINNAGTATPMMNFWELSPDQYTEVVYTNILGTMYGSKVAITGMITQGYGAVYNMEGFGAKGRAMRGMTLYGSTKASVHFINRSLIDEIKTTPVMIGALAPGMVITDMVTQQFKGREDELEKSKRILNIIGERAETVAPVLVEKILANNQSGNTIVYSSSLRMMVKFLTAPFIKRDLFSEIN
jgi:short-subunit dehydrogenase